MSQLLSFVTRRRRSNEEDANSFPMMINSQNSSDTVSTFSEWNDNFICIPRRKGVTVTPEGLLPRKPLSELRAELLPPTSSPIEKDVEGPLVETKSAIVPSNQENTPSLAVSTFQKLPAQPSRSWSTRSSSYLYWGSSSSPLSPTTMTTTWTAESPNLLPGQARTAVGNLVGVLEQQQQDPPGLTPLQEKKNDNSWSPTYSPQEERVESMFSPLSSKNRKEEMREPSTKRSRNSVLFSPVTSEKSKGLSPGSSRKLICASSSDSDVAMTLGDGPSWRQITTTSSHPSLDQDMKRIKARNQYQAKEELCLQVLERLQDNIELVKKIDGLFPWFGNDNDASIQGGSLISGFVEQKRYNISDKLDLLLNELNSGVQTEEFFFSPGKADMTEYQDESNHRELRKAVGFCKVLVQMAIPTEENETNSIQGTSEVGQWRFLFGEEIGLEIPDTPQRGHGSFSFPENEAHTPMTSNVSLGASTLTSRPQPVVALPGPPQNGLDLRHALQTFISAMKKTGDACSNFAEMGSLSPTGLVRTAEKLKQTYSSLMDLNVLDLRFMVDAFEFVVDGSTEIESPVMRAETLGSGMIANVSIQDTSSFDDLRREVGSIDYSDEGRDRWEGEFSIESS